MPEFQTPAAFLLLLFIPTLYIFRKLGFFSRISLVTTFSNWNGKSFTWNKKFRNFGHINKILEFKISNKIFSRTSEGK